jgi:hypothetical protein
MPNFDYSQNYGKKSVSKEYTSIITKPLAKNEQSTQWGGIFSADFLVTALPQKSASP